VDDAAGQSDWTPLLFDEFRKRRGYDLRRELPALLATDGSERSLRVLVDYRETLSDLLLDGSRPNGGAGPAETARSCGTRPTGRQPASWTSTPRATSRDGGPGSLPGQVGELRRQPHGEEAGRGRGGTWLGEHFVSTLADVRAAVDRYFVGGVNHVVYHGTAYSPPGEPWPGWLFYASVHFQPSNTWWTDLALLNRT